MNLLTLVVDDEPDVEVLFRQHFRRDLRAGRFTMEFAQSAPAALQRITAAAGMSLILILSDINMPGMSGLELLPKAKALRPDVPVSMITAYGDAERKRKALENGAEALLTNLSISARSAAKSICALNTPHEREGPPCSKSLTGLRSSVSGIRPALCRKRHRFCSPHQAHRRRPERTRRHLAGPPKAAVGSDRRTHSGDAFAYTGKAEGSGHRRAPPSHRDVLGPRRFDRTLSPHGPGGPTRGHFGLPEMRRRDCAALRWVCGEVHG